MKWEAARNILHAQRGANARINHQHKFEWLETMGEHSHISPYHQGCAFSKKRNLKSQAYYDMDEGFAITRAETDVESGIGNWPS